MTYGEARHWVFLLPAALDGKLSIVARELRSDLAAMVVLQMLHGGMDHAPWRMGMA